MIMDYGLRIMLGGGIMVWIVPAILIGLIILSIFKITSKDKQSNKAKEILKIKYVNGEIDEKEYLKKMNKLED